MYKRHAIKGNKLSDNIKGVIEREFDSLVSKGNITYDNMMPFVLPILKSIDEMNKDIINSKNSNSLTK